MSGRSLMRQERVRSFADVIGIAVIGALLVGALAVGASVWPVPRAHAETLADDAFNDAGCHGQRQSPVDLGAAEPAPHAGLQLSYAPFAAEFAHLEHTVQVAPRGGEDGANFLTLGGTRFDFLQFHFHHPSEHALAGKRWPMEMHLVHRSADGKLAVLGVLLRPGRENDGLANILAALPPSGQKRPVAKPVDLAQFLPSSAASYHYAGSLTTPPCSEIVSWIVFRDPIEAGIGQIESLTRAFSANARPLQPSAGRPIGLDLF